MCGISGYCGSKSYNPYVLKLLSLFNQERGDDSVGIVNNDELFVGYGVKDGKAWDFQKKFHYAKRPKNKTILQHNRSRSSGFIDKNSAHPYTYEYEHEDGKVYNFYFSHNGTLKFPSDLGSHYKEKYSDYHTDSHMFGQLILKHGWEPLSYYEGGAALAFYWGHEPNTLYLWKGASEQSTNFTKAKKEYQEERPLYYVYDKGGIYYSSLSEYLVGCGFDESEILSVPENTLLKFKDGEIVEEINIERKQLPKPKYKPSNNVVTYRPDDRPIEYDPRKFIKDKVVYYKNTYYHDGKELHGIYKINPDYSLDVKFKNEYSTFHYFLNGFWLKDRKAYDRISEILKTNPSYIFKIGPDLHPESLVYNKKDEYFYKDIDLRKITEPIRPKFCFFYYTFSRKAKFKGNFHPYTAISHGFLDSETYLIEKFNSFFSLAEKGEHCYVNTIEECKEVAKMFDWGSDDPLDDVKTIEWPNVINLHDDYIALERKWKAELDNTDLPLLSFNQKYFGVDERMYCTTRIEANTWYYATYGRDYNKDWGKTTSESITQ